MVMKSVNRNRAPISASDAMLITLAHRMLEYPYVATWSPWIAEARGAIKAVDEEPGESHKSVGQGNVL